MKVIKLFILTVLIVSCGQSDQPLKDGMYRINGTVKNMDQGHLFLLGFADNKRTIDTLVVSQGAFIYEGRIDALVKHTSLATSTEVRSSDDMQALYIEPTVMHLNVDANDIHSAVLTGSSTQDEAATLTALREEIAIKYKAELDAFNANRVLYNEASTEEDKKKYKWKDDELRTALEPYYEEGSAVLKQFVLDHPKSYVSFQNLLFILNDLNQEEAKAIFANFPEEYKKESRAERILKDINDMSKGIPGAMAGDFNTTDINGKPIALADFKGQYLLIDFWASWCVPCRKGNPHLLDLYAKYKSKGLEILGVSDDDSNHDAWRKAVKDDQIGVWRHVLRGLEIDRSNGGYNILNDGISGGYNISTLPTKILVGPDGIIIGRYGGGGEDDAAMDKKLKEIFLDV